MNDGETMAKSRAARGPAAMGHKAAFNLRREFDAVRRRYFPRWRAGALWSVSARAGSRAAVRNGHGYCDPERREISIGFEPEPGLSLAVTLIHEICHAVASCSHGRPWLRRMGQAKARAEALGDHAVVEAISDEIAAYSVDQPSPSAQVYGRLRDLGFEGITWRHAVAGAAYEFGMLRRELLAQFPRARREHDKGVRERARIHAAREAMRARAVRSRAEGRGE